MNTKTIDTLSEELQNRIRTSSFSDTYFSTQKKYSSLTPKQIPSYNHQDDLANALSAISSQHGQEAEYLFKATLIIDTLKEQGIKDYVNFKSCIQKQYQQNFERIIAAINKDISCEILDGDNFWKELSICKTNIFPAAAQLVDIKSSLSKSLFMGGNLIRHPGLFFHALSKKNYYQIHSHTPTLSNFNEKGWEECYRIMAENIKDKNNAAGFYGTSWFYDPKISDISPRLAYLVKTPLEGGAKLLYLGNDPSDNAIQTSKTRRELYKEGKYTPKLYTLIWQRQDLLNWAF